VGGRLHRAHHDPQRRGHPGGGADLFAAIFLAGFVVTQFASGIAAQASVSRLLYAMGRDRVLPQKVFAYLQPRFRTPAVGIAICGLAGLIGLTLDVEGAVSLINFGVIIDLYLLFNLSGLAKLLGLCWLALGFLYRLVLTRGFRRPPPELDTLAAEQEVPQA
jgi:putrescine importer